VVETLSNISPDNILRLPKKTHNVWVFAPGVIDTYDIKLKNIIHTH
jgi:hypothetical protein